MTATHLFAALAFAFALVCGVIVYQAIAMRRLLRRMPRREGDR